MADDRPAMAAPVDTPLTAMAATEAAPMVEKAAAVPARLIERPTWRIMSWRIMPPVERPAGRHRVILACALVSALGMATVSAGFSIFGFTIVFGGYFWPIIAMGCWLEACKLSGVAWLGTGRGSRRLRATVTVLVGILMTLNAVGCFGFLVRAHVGHQVAGETAVTARLADVDARIELAARTLADLDRRLGQIDGSIEGAMARGKVNTAMALAGDQRRNRTDLQVERMAAGKILVGLKVEKAKIEGERRMVDADLGPVLHLATLLNTDEDSALRYFILVVAMLLDPAAVLLLLCATAAPRTA
jgi:hypothetical protein